MAHHKRRRAKNRRAGCLLCKPHKCNGAKHEIKHSDQRRSLRYTDEGTRKAH